jgi:hypothetical protein
VWSSRATWTLSGAQTLTRRSCASSKRGRRRN